MIADAVHPHPDPARAEGADFTLSSGEVEKGRLAVEAYLTSIRVGEARELAEEELHNLALLFTGGLCNAYEFPWQQLHAYHVAAVLAMLKQEGTPAQIEAMRLQRDPGWRYRQMPDAFPSKEIQRLRARLRGVLRACHALGFLTEGEFQRAVKLPKVRGKRPAPGRTLSDGEYRALLAVCEADDSPEGPRDALMFCLAYKLGLRQSELIALTLEDLGFDSKRERVTVRVKQGKKSRGRTVPLHNAALVALEDWLEWRGRSEGPLLCPIRKDGTVEVCRLTAPLVRQSCGKRAQEGGLEAFSANDLARSSASPRLTKKSRGSENPSRRKSKAWSPGASALYSGATPPGAGGEASPEAPAATVQFPYLARNEADFGT